MAEELEQLRHQNKHLMDRMKELDISVEQYTDTEKLIMKIGSGSVKSLGKSGDSVSDHPLNPSISCDSLSTDGAKAGESGMVIEECDTCKSSYAKITASCTMPNWGESSQRKAGTLFASPVFNNFSPTKFSSKSVENCPYVQYCSEPL